MRFLWRYASANAVFIAFFQRRKLDICRFYVAKLSL
nr:MAG TPA: hypothetical protein [Bacteriophage sp.]